MKLFKTVLTYSVGTFALVPTIVLAGYKTPDVFIEEIKIFPAGIEGVETELPGIGASDFQVDSFFDVFTEVSIDDPCDPCKAIEKEITEKQGAIDGLKEDLSTLEGWLDDLESNIDNAEDTLDEVKDELAEFLDPQNYVESEGRRYDSSDHAAMRRRSANLWGAYKAGDLTAQEYSDEIGKNFDDPDVAQELAKLKKEIEKDLRDEIADIEGDIKLLKDKQKEWNELGEVLTAELENCLDKLEELLKALEECKKQCKDGAVAVGGLGVTPDTRSFLDWLGDAFGPPPPVFPGLDTVVERLDPGPPGAAGEVPIELVALDLVSVEPITVTPPNPEPRCQMCDPILAELKAKEMAIDQAKQQLASIEGAIKTQDNLIETGEDILDTLTDQLDLINNPPARAESGGRSMDSNDLAASRIRSQRLWGQYRSGALSASDLEAEWEKQIDHPDVQKDLEEIKKQMKQEVEDAIDDVKDAIENLQAVKDMLEKEAERLRKHIADCEGKLAEIRRRYQDCLKKCKELDDAVGFIRDLIGDDSPWTPPTGGFTVPLPEDKPVEIEDEADDAPPCMNTRECEETCLPQGKACAKVERDGKTCNECTDDNDCDVGTVDLKSCEENCSSGDCTRDFKAGPACFRCTNGCLKPTMTSRQCEETCVIEGGGCIKNPEGGKNCFDCTMENYCEEPLMNYKECNEKCEGCTRDFKAGLACFKCDKLKEEPKDDTAEAIEFIDDLLEEDDLVGTDLDADSNFICRWFGAFCPDPTLDYIIGCAAGGDGNQCGRFDHNDDGNVDIEDLSNWTPTLTGPGGLDLPLVINELDGNDDLSLTDFVELNNCFGGGPLDCGGLDFGLPGNDVLFGDNTVGLGGGDFRPQLVNGSDILLGDPLNDNLINTGGGRDTLLGDDPFPGDDLLGPGNDPIPSPPGGFDLDLFGDSQNDDVPPPPPTSQQNMANDPQVRQVVAAAVAAYVRQNPLGPCEKLEVTVRRVRVGNRVSYTVRIRRLFDPSKCPPPPDDGEGFESSGVPLFEDGFESGDTSKWSTGDDVIDEQPPEPLECDDGTSEKSVCERSCDNECIESYTREDSVACFVCVQPPEPEEPEQCDSGTSEHAVCQRECDGECVKSYTRKDDVDCFTCAQPPEPEPEKCDDGTVEQDACDRSCDGICSRAYVRKDGVGCYVCEEQPPEPLECDSPTMTESACKKSCDGTCTKEYTRDDGVKCFVCIEEQPPEPLECDSGTTEADACARSCDGECQRSYVREDGVACDVCVQPPEPEDTGPSCPSGQTANKSDCESQCPSDGVCIAEGDCFSCVVVNCPDGTTKNECPSSCSNGCNVVGEQHGVKCYQCKEDCNTVCANNDYGPESTDHSDAILGELNGYSCVSGANISIQTATIGDCKCVGDYSLQVDTTPPVCAGTPCGDIACMQPNDPPVTCSGGPNETITVRCNWGGWQKIQKHQFRPLVGN